MPTFFLDPMEAGPEGLVAVGGTLSTTNLVEAYSRGIFPWPHPDLPMLWFSPDPRGILEFDEFHIRRSLKKFILAHPGFRITINQVFSLVIKECQSQPRPGQTGSWITDEILSAYIQLFNDGKILCVEVWDGPSLIGGIYGVLSENYFSAESMFYKKSNASKIAFVHLVETLKSRGHTWMDLQMITDVSQSFGGKYIPKIEFLDRIKRKS